MKKLLSVILMVAVGLFTCAFDEADKDEIPGDGDVTAHTIAQLMEEDEGAVRLIEFEDHVWKAELQNGEKVVEYYYNPKTKTIIVYGFDTENDEPPLKGQINEALLSNELINKKIREIKYEGDNVWKAKYITEDNQEKTVKVKMSLGGK